jgi:hypothetical protein
VTVIPKKPPFPVDEDVETPLVTVLGVEVTETNGKKKFRVRADSTGVLLSIRAARTMQHVAARMRAMLLFGLTL